MAEKTRYPQIPGTVWWGVRSILNKTPKVAIDERFLSVQLDVQEVAAKTYLSELKNVGILTEEGRATPIANKWRLDDSYQEAVQELLASAYPEGLLHIAPAGEANRHKVANWFLKEGLGQGSANNRAATYLLMSSPVPNEAPNRGTSTNKKEANIKPNSKRGASKSPKRVKADSPRGEGGYQSSNPISGHPEHIPLNINVQIHISADAGSEQIEAIFSAMRRYLYDNKNS